MRIHLHTYKQQIGHEKEIDTNTRTELFLEESFRLNASQTANFKDYRDTNVQGRYGEEDWKYYFTLIVQEVLTFFQYNDRGYSSTG